jgi:pimeloyl-ACP methyl ester carboxylesterase
MPKARISDIDIFYEEEGRGEPLLLAPPSWWPSDTWKVGVVPFLSKHYRTIIFDCRGTGHSSKPDHGYTIEQFAKDCAGLLEHLEVPRCHAVGFALGGQIVQALAIQRPDLVATVTIAAAGAGTIATGGGPRQGTNVDDQEIRVHGFERFIRGHVENTHMAFNERFFAAHPQVVQALSDALWQRQTSAEQHRYHYDARRTWDTLGNGPKVTVPTLVLCGADDDVNRGGSTPVGTARRLAELIPGSELVLVPDVKHMTFWDGDGAVKSLENFLVRHPIGAG